MADRSLIPAVKPAHAWGRGLSIAFLCLGLVGVVVLAVLGYPTYAAWLVSTLLATFATLRFILPGRPWFSSRNKVVDVIVLGSLAVLIAYFSQYATVPAS